MCMCEIALYLTSNAVWNLRRLCFSISHHSAQPTHHATPGTCGFYSTYHHQKKNAAQIENSHLS